MAINSPLKKPYGGTFNGKTEIVEGFVQRSMQLVKEGASFNIVNSITEGSRVVI